MPPPWWWWSILEYLVTSLRLCPLVTLSLYGAQVYLFLPAEIICIHSQYFKQFSCQILFADPGKFPLYPKQICTYLGAQGTDGRGEFHFLTQVLTICKLLSSSQCQLFPGVPWPRPPAGFWIFHLNKHSAPASPPGLEAPDPPGVRDIVVMTMQTIQIGLSGRLPVYWNSRGLETIRAISWLKTICCNGLFLCLEDLPRS